MIKIPVRDITVKGVDINQVLPKESIGLTNEEVDLHSPLTIFAHLEKIENVVVVDAEIKVEQGYLCARCLENLKRKETKNYHFEFPLDPSVEYIDLGEEIRQEMIMDILPRILCKESCKGICAGCGANLNEEKCKCK